MLSTQAFSSKDMPALFFTKEEAIMPLAHPTIASLSWGA
jgi:hypothetical protein